MLVIQLKIFNLTMSNNHSGRPGQKWVKTPLYFCVGSAVSVRTAHYCDSVDRPGVLLLINGLFLQNKIQNGAYA